LSFDICVVCLISLGRRRGGLGHKDTFSKVSALVDLRLTATLESTFENLYLGRRRGGHGLGRSAGRSTGRIFDLVGNVFRDRFFDKTEKIGCRALELRLRLVSDLLRLLLCFLGVFRQLDVLDLQRG
jgi:hypothetical protein